MADISKCIFCEKEAALKFGCTKQRWSVCDDHFMVTCPKCGHEAFWMENMKDGSYFTCFRIAPFVCTYKSTTPP